MSYMLVVSFNCFCKGIACFRVYVTITVDFYRYTHKCSLLFTVPNVDQHLMSTLCITNLNLHNCEFSIVYKDDHVSDKKVLEI